MQDSADDPGGKILAPPRRGRPRDPGIELRVFKAALQVYAAEGWAGFNFDAVARGAGVGKDAIYRRWPARDALLGEALRKRWDGVGEIDEGCVRDDLLALGRMTLDIFTGTYGEVALQLRADARRFTEVRAFVDPYRETVIHQGRNIVRKAIARGEFPSGANPALIMDLLIGAIINHIISTPQRLRSRMLDQADRFVSDVVDIIMAGAERISVRDGMERG
jgi:AcrR family transcriptional regulator